MIEKKVMLIDLNSCSGCHACSVSCKAEHRAPLGLFRHRVQSVEEGSFPKVTHTSFATICALIPLAAGALDGVLISQGLAVVVIGGLITSIILTLCIVPLVYELLHLRTHRREMKKGRHLIMNVWRGQLSPPNNTPYLLFDMRSGFNYRLY